MRIKSPAPAPRFFLWAGLWSVSGCWLCGLVLFCGCLALRAEENSPEPDSPEKYNLPGRAIPEMPIRVPPPNPRSTYEPLFRLTLPYYNNLFAVPPPDLPYYLDPSSYTKVISDGELRGLRPVQPEDRLWTFHPFVGVQRSYDSNIQQTPQNHIGDFSTILRAGFDYQLGSPDSIYSEGYDTILALNMHEEFWAEIFDRHGEFNALNDKIQIDGRIGRDAAIWRPFVFADDVTGSNLLTENRVGRVERQHLVTGVRGDYELTSQFSASQTLSHEYFEHPDDPYIDFEMWKIYQEVDYRMLHDFDFFAWTQFLYTDVDKGADGKEYFGGIGWRGKPDPRLASEFRLGWDDVHLNQPQADRFPLSGIHLFGHTSFEWSPRLRLVLIYDRDYTFNEIVVNDNYVDNIIQFVPEIYLGDNWYVTPYFGVSYDQYETSHHDTLEFRPEIEVAYVTPNTSKIFVKFGYDHVSTIKGPDTGAVDIYRVSTGIRWKF
jgi:hypothetical protein